ncbi:ferritin-like domain-containing protein [Nguyenibacter vanlangensis]|uniref:Ferritin-like domain-containing protein n=1 Tax=Nguyenibacter vanlangensis TaxID=1216886 RepID=A0ABZ3D061_9PROT
MSKTPSGHLLDWLRDAHAMEEQAEKMLQAQAARLENYPILQEKIRQHLEETRRQATLIRGCIERHGSSPSGLKDTGGKLMAMLQGLGGSLMADEVIKGSMASYAFEHFEVSAYVALIAAAEFCGDIQTRDVCAQILEEEKAMAEWLAQALPETVGLFLTRDSTETGSAKR